MIGHAPVEAVAAVTGEAAAAHRPLQRERRDVGLARADVDDEVAVGATEPNAGAHRRCERCVEEVDGASTGKRGGLEQPATLRHPPSRT